MFFLIVKFIQITFDTLDTKSCKAISYFVSAFTRSIYWLTSWISLERLLIALFPVSRILRMPRLAIGISTIIQYLVPFCIQIISIILLIFVVTRSRWKTTGEKVTFRQALNKQFRTQKELYITPMIIICSVLPQTILTFSLA